MWRWRNLVFVCILYKFQAHNLADGCSYREKLKISMILMKNTYKKLELNMK